MKKKILLLISSCIACLLAVGFSSCGTHKHKLGELQAEVDATCTKSGIKAHYVCSGCGTLFDENKTETALQDLITDAKGHNFTYVSNNDATCTKDGTQTVTCNNDGCNESKKITIENSKLPHVLNEYNHCENCEYFENQPTYTEGLTFTKIDGKDEYKITESSLGTAEKAVIPISYKGLPVTQIDGTAFPVGTDIKEISLPKTIVSLGKTVLENCSKLEHIYYCGEKGSLTVEGDEDKTLDELLFYYSEEKTSVCGNYWNFDDDGKETTWKTEHVYDFVDENGLFLCKKCNERIEKWELIFNVSGSTITGMKNIGNTIKNLTIPSIINGVTMTSIGKKAFHDNTMLVSVVIPESITSIGSEAFLKNTALKSVVILGSGIVLDFYNFSQCYALTTFTVPEDISISGFALGACSNLKTINYGGTVEQWKATMDMSIWISHWDINPDKCVIVCSNGKLNIKGEIL